MRRVMIIAVIMMLLSACGYRGALFLPEQAPSNQAENSEAVANSSDQN